MNEKVFERWMRRFFRFIVLFAMNAFVVSCSFLLFLKDMELNEAQIRISGKTTFLNVVLLTMIYLMIDALRERKTVKEPLQRITEGLRRIDKGDFKTYIEPVSHWQNGEIFNPIIYEINLMTLELSSVETLRTDFISNVSHELKTPLAIISNYSTLLQNKNLSEAERHEYIKAISDTSKNLANLVSNVLKLNKLENQKLHPEINSFNLSEHVIECVLNFESTWEKKQIEIETDIDEDVVIQSDRELLSLVWNNLISNAVKFTNEKGKITISVKKDGNAVLVSVKDTGCGMSKQTGDHIFEKFYQGDTSRSTQGNGLGLAMVKKVIELLHGDIFVRSELGKGAEFTVCLLVNTYENN